MMEKKECCKKRPDYKWMGEKLCFTCWRVEQVKLVEKVLSLGLSDEILMSFRDAVDIIVVPIKDGNLVVGETREYKLVGTLPTDEGLTREEGRELAYGLVMWGMFLPFFHETLREGLKSFIKNYK